MNVLIQYHIHQSIIVLQYHLITVKWYHHSTSLYRHFVIKKTGLVGFYSTKK